MSGVNGKKSPRIALAQMNSSSDWRANLQTILERTAEAARKKAGAILFPENSLFMGAPSRLRSVGVAIQKFALPRIIDAAREHSIAVLIGGHPEPCPLGRKVWNTALWIDEKGKLLARYRKIHLFDVRTPSGDRFKESRFVAAGDRLVTFRWRGVRIGMSICYDVRFPELYRGLGRKGVDWILVPAAFTYETGRRHWLPLLTARAIENLAVVLAPAQTGRHPMGRRTYGHCLCIGPWGEILVDKGTEPGVVYVRPPSERAIGELRQRFGTYASYK